MIFLKGVFPGIKTCSAENLFQRQGSAPFYFNVPSGESFFQQRFKFPSVLSNDPFRHAGGTRGSHFLRCVFLVA